MSQITYSNRPAFPDTITGKGLTQTHPGLTKREYIAAKVLAGLLASNQRYTGDQAAARAIEYTDSLLSKLQTSNNSNDK